MDDSPGFQWIWVNGCFYKLLHAFYGMWISRFKEKIEYQIWSVVRSPMYEILISNSSTYFQSLAIGGLLLGNLNYFDVRSYPHYSKDFLWMCNYFVVFINSRMEVMSTLGAYRGMFYYVGLRLRFLILCIRSRWHIITMKNVHLERWFLIDK